MSDPAGPGPSGAMKAPGQSTSGADGSRPPMGEPKVGADHWDETWSRPPRPRLPSRLWVGVRDLQRLLRAHVRRDTSVLEIGCAPGKMLAWMAGALGARVAGLEPSERGIGFARALFRQLGLQGDLRQEELDTTTFQPGTFDLVFSAGLIEHFEDPAPVVRRHVELTRPGGTALIVIPNYGGIYGRLQAHFDPANLRIHNLAIMTPAALAALAPRDLVSEARAYPAGCLSPWLIHLEARWPRALAKGLTYALNGVGLLQPVEIAALCSSLVLELRRRGAPGC